MTSWSDAFFRQEEILSAVTTTVLTVACVVIHVPLILIVARRTNCQSSFFIICAGRSCAHVLGALSVGISCAGALFINRPFLPTFINGYYFLLTFLFLTELVISVNRFLAVTWFAYFNSVFSARNTLIFLFFSVVLTIIRSVTSVLSDCFAVFDHTHISMFFDLTKCGSDIAFMAVFEVLMCIAFILNLLTLYKLVKVTKKGVGSDRVAKERLKQNKTHFMFTFAQSVIWMVVGLSILVRSDIFRQHRYLHYVIENLVEFMGSVAEGLLFWLLHWKKITSGFKPSLTSSIVQQSTTPRRSQFPK